MKHPLAKLSFALVSMLSLSAASGANWPGWRGQGTGVSTEKNLPQSWTTNENVRWKIALPGPGNSSPIVWGGLDYSQRYAGLVIEQVVGALGFAAGRELAANNDAAFGERNLLADLAHQVPLRARERRRDKLCADIAFAEAFLVNPGH
jgi:hypothetical protein